LTVKPSLIFEKRFAVLKTVNRFLKLNYLSLHACLISDCRNSTMVGRWNLAALESGNIRLPEYCRRRNPTTSGHRLRMPADQISAMVRSRPDLAKVAGSDRIRPDLAKMAGIRPDPEESGWNPAILVGFGQTCSPESATATGRYWIPATVTFSPFVIFSCELNAEKYF
jgi:hypothetical protein